MIPSGRHNGVALDGCIKSNWRPSVPSDVWDADVSCVRSCVTTVYILSFCIWHYVTLLRFMFSVVISGNKTNIMMSKWTNKLKSSVVSTSSSELKGVQINVYQTHFFAPLFLTGGAVFSTNHASLLHQTGQMLQFSLNMCVSSFTEVWVATGAADLPGADSDIQTYVTHEWRDNIWHMVCFSAESDWWVLSLQHGHLGDTWATTVPPSPASLSLSLSAVRAAVT